jgi:O-antigen/teichoic acid export membrane protein
MNPRILALSGRGRTFYGTAFWSFIAKAAAGACLLLSMPMIIGRFGVEQFGAWATLSSFVALTPLLDFGIGNAALNLISDARGRQADRECSFLLRMTAVRTMTITVFLAVPVIAAVFVAPWWSILGLLKDLDETTRQAAAIVAFAFVVNIPLAVGLRMQFALDQAASAFKWQTAGQFLSVFAIYLVCQSSSTTFPILCAAGVLPTTLCSAINCIQMQRRQTWYAIEENDQSLVKELGENLRRLSRSFFMLQIASILAYASDLAIISSRLGAAEAAIYAASQRVFGIIPSTASLLWAPLWPQYRRALAAGEIAWSKRTFRRSLFLAVGAASTLAVCAFLAFPWIVAMLGRGQINPSIVLNSGFAVWVVMDCLGGAIAVLMNAGGAVRFQLRLAVVFAAATSVSKIVLAPVVGVSAIPWITCAAYLGLVLIPTFMARKQLAHTIFKSS